MLLRKIVILGSTGSIGQSTIDVVIHHPGSFDVVGLATHSNIELLSAQFQQLRPSYLCVINPEKADLLSKKLAEESVEILAGEEGIIKLAGLSGVDIVVNAVVGAAGLQASLETIKTGKNLALANKESLVAGGPLFPSLVKKYEGKILPIDSEHSALWQALACGKPEEVKKLIVTASGGPFRDLPADQFSSITPEQALNHPTWKMGSKITIDSATLVNKGLEVIEAVQLFDVPVDKVEVVIHPQSIIHSMVEFVDSSIIAQLSKPDMRLPITYALFWPDRPDSDYGQLDMSQIGQLTFEKPDHDRFPALKLAYHVARVGGTAPAIFNAANEVAVAAFLDRKIPFTAIADIIGETGENINVVSSPLLDDILDADRQARKLATEKVEKQKW